MSFSSNRFFKPNIFQNITILVGIRFVQILSNFFKHRFIKLNILQHQTLKIFLQCLVWTIYAMKKKHMSLPPLRDVWPTYVQGHLSDLKNCTVQSSSRFIDFVNRGLLFTPNSSLNLIVKVADSCLKSMSQSKSMWESFCSKKIFCKRFACKLCEFLMQDIQRNFLNRIHILIAIIFRMPKAIYLS